MTTGRKTCPKVGSSSRLVDFEDVALLKLKYSIMLEAAVRDCVGKCERETNNEAASHSAIVAQRECLSQKAPSIFKVERSTYVHD